MQTSEQVNEIASALAKAQGEMAGAVKDSANPFFKSKYADLASVWDACRAPLSNNGLAVLQSPTADGVKVSVETLLVHSSGQWMRDTLSVSAKEDSPQAVGSAITYLRRYSLQSFAGVAPEDDDGEAAHGRSSTPSRFDKQPTYPPQTVSLREEAPTEDGELTITRVDSTPTKNKNVMRHLVHLSDGRQLSTINRALGTRCKEYADAAAIVEVQCHQTTYGLELDEVSSPSDPKSTATVELSASDIPFAWLAALAVPLIGVLLA